MTWERSVIMIGLDAATWDVMNPLLASGRLPNVSALVREGASGRLHSILPYPSPALWTSIITGRLPEKHGVLDFYSATRSHIRVATLYDILAGDNGNVGLFRWHATWPPAQNAGFTVPSYIARSPETHPAELDFLNDLARPKGIGSYLRGGLQLMRHGAGLATVFKSAAELIYEVAARPEQREWWYRRRVLETAINGEVFAHLLRKHRPPFAAILFSIIDDFGHHYWRYREPELFDDVTDAEARKYGGVIDAAYIAADKALGTILQSVPEEALVVVLSDHGQRAISPLVRPYRILSQRLVTLLGYQDKVWVTDLGYSSLFRPRATQEGQGTLRGLREALEQVRLKQDQRAVFQISGAQETHLEVRAGVEGGTDLKSPVSLPGGGTAQLGDVIFTRGRISGHHSNWGILILKGPGVRTGCEIEASLLDVTPTILALTGQPVARDMDGQVVVDAIQDCFLQENPLRYVESYETATHVEEMSLTEEEQEELEAKLRALGYLS